MSKAADVVIIGGGVVGASIAWHLSEAGAGHIVVLERECQPGLGSTGRATGGVRAQFRDPIDVRVSLHSLDCFRRFRDLTGVDPGYRPNGYLYLATSAEELTVLRENVAVQHGAGLADVSILDREEAAYLVPYVATDDVLGASFAPGDGFIDPLRVLEGFFTRAVERGVEILTESEVVAIETGHGAVQAVATARGRIATRCVVNAAGAWAGRVAALAGVDLPVAPLRRHVAGTQPLSAVPDEAPMVIEIATGFHFRKDHLGGGGLLLLWGDPEERPGEDTRFDPGWLRRMLPLARRRVPQVESVLVSPRRSWAGLYEMTPDGRPVLGAAPGVSGLWLANGFSGHGVMHAPATGRILADLITSGATTLVDVTPFALERFAAGRPVAESGGPL